MAGQFVLFSFLSILPFLLRPELAQPSFPSIRLLVIPLHKPKSRKQPTRPVLYFINPVPSLPFPPFLFCCRALVALNARRIFTCFVARSDVRCRTVSAQERVRSLYRECVCYPFRLAPVTGLSPTQDC